MKKYVGVLCATFFGLGLAADGITDRDSSLPVQQFFSKHGSSKPRKTRHDKLPQRVIEIGSTVPSSLRFSYSAQDVDAEKRLRMYSERAYHFHDREAPSALLIALSSNDPEVVSLALKVAGPYDFLQKKNTQISPLHRLCRSGNIEHVRSFFERKKILPELAKQRITEERDCFGRTVLLAVVASEDSETKLLLVKELIANGADVNAHIDEVTVSDPLCSDFRKTALHFAVQRGDRELVDLLLSANADKNLRDNMGKKPLDFLERQLQAQNLLDEETRERYEACKALLMIEKSDNE